MKHKPLNELADEIVEWKKRIHIGSKYIHYKHPGRTYTVQDIVVHESSNEIEVLYRADYPPHLPFVRPASEWLEEVDGVPRFKKV